MILVCLRCEAEFAGYAEEQVALFNAHPCGAVEDIRREQIEAARRRHPTGRNVDPIPKPTRLQLVAVIAAVVALALANWIVETLASFEWFGIVLIVWTFVALTTVIVYNAVKLTVRR